MSLLSDTLVTLRGVEPGDLDYLYRWENDTQYWGVGTTLTPFSRHTLIEFIAAQGEDIFSSRQLRLMVESGGECVGMVDIFDIDPYHLRAGVGVFISPEHQRRGYASAAINLVINYAREALLLHQIWCSVAGDNKASLALFDSLNFSQVGVRREWIRTGACSFVDEYLFTKIIS